jgi:hypothetical protein
MDSVPRRSLRVPVPTCHFDGFVSTRNLRLGFAELLAAAYVSRTVMRGLYFHFLSLFIYCMYYYSRSCD